MPTVLMPIVLGEAIQIRCPLLRSSRADVRMLSTMVLVLLLSVVALLPYGGSVTMQQTCVSGSLRASAIISASAVKLKCFKLRFVPSVILRCTSMPIACTPMSVASISVVPVPQNGSSR